jgi:hypothetical protein
MKQEKNILKKLDVQPFENQDLFLNIKLTSNVKNLKENFINNNFDVISQYELERNISRKFFIYGKLYSKNVDTTKLTISFKTSNGDTLSSPDIKNNLLGANEKIAYVKPNIFTANNSLSKNIFNKNISTYFFQFEIEKDLNNKTNKLLVEIVGNSSNLPNNQYNQVKNIFEIDLVNYDDEGIFVPFGSDDTIFDEDLNFIDINNDYPFLYDYHFIKQDFDIVDFNNVFFPFTTYTNPDGTVSFYNSITITDLNLFPKFKLLMDFESQFGNEKAIVEAKIVTNSKDRYFLPDNLYDSNIFNSFSSWKGFPQTISQWNIFSSTVKQKLRNIFSNDFSYGNQEIYNTPEEFYDKTHRYLLSFYKGCNLDVRNPLSITNDFILKAFLSYNSSLYKKDVNNTEVGEFIENVLRGGNVYFDKAEVNFSKNEKEKTFEIDLTKANITQLNEIIQLDITSVQNVEKNKFPTSLFVNLIAENKKPTAFFENNFLSVEATSQNLPVKIKLDKPHNGLSPFDLKIKVIEDLTDALNILDYQILQDTATINPGDIEAEFLIRINYSNKYFSPKNLYLELIQNGDDVIILENLNNINIEIQTSNITCWTKYEFIADSLFGFGIFRTNRSVSNSNEIFNFQLQNSDASNLYIKNSFISKFNYEIECINRGDVTIFYDGEYGGEVKEIEPGETLFTQLIEDEFNQLSYILPTNSQINSFIDSENVQRNKFLKSKYEFVIKNIQPVVSNSNIDSDTYADAIITSENLPSIDIIKSKKTSEIWRNILRDINFFQTQNVGISIFEKITNSPDLQIRDLIKPELDIQLQQIFNGLLLSTDYVNTNESFNDLNPLAKIVRKAIFALRTRVSNVYYPRPKFTNYNPISTVISQSLLNDNFINTGVIKGNADMFGTVLLNKSIIGQDATKIIFRKFSNRLDLIQLSVPSQITFNKFYQDTDSDFAFEYKKYFRFNYKILLQNSNIINTNNEKVNEDLANSFAITSNAPNFDSENLINSLNSFNPNFNAISLIKFSPNSSFDTNSFSDDIFGIKPLPVYIPIDINKPENKLIS